ncbi:MAG TPA: acetyl ornithine aminotransferase family protein [Candidatus Acidoferrales bacterium]|nr:acetyl ornithine aminotransferase family protein [Candidatus Acidoferrales bacterium]
MRKAQKAAAKPAMKKIVAIDSATTAAAAEKLAKLVTALPGPNAKKILKLDDRYISPSYTRGYPLVVKSGRGAVVEDVDGNRFLDFAAGIAVVATGHCHPEVVAAIQKQAAELIHISGTDFYIPNMVELAEKLAQIAPGKGAKKVYFGNSGTEAIEAAIKLARYHTGREKILAFYGCFHGRTIGSLSLTASKAVQRKGFGSLLSGVFHAPYPDPYYAGKSAVETSADCIAFIEKELFKRIVDPQDIAAIFVEPIQGEGGYIPAPAEFLRELRRIATQHGILLVSDEVQCGMGRTGKWWAGDHVGFEPDITCVAKGIASGMPLCATIARDDVMDWKPGAHASTFGGNPVCIAASLATIKLLENGYMENARKMGDFILGHIADWPKRHKCVGEIRGKGLMIGVEIVLDQNTRERAHDLRDAIVDLAFTKGLLILGAGENSIRLAPPLLIDQDQAHFALDTLDSCITELERKL